jgi:hypothetical protein
MTQQSEHLRKAIENLVNAKLSDVLARSDGLARFAAHRCTGVASHEIRNAERQLDDALRQIVANRKANALRN